MIIVKWKNIAKFMGVSEQKAKDFHKDEGLPVWVDKNTAMTTSEDIFKWIQEKLGK